MARGGAAFRRSPIVVFAVHLATADAVPADVPSDPSANLRLVSAAAALAGELGVAVDPSEPIRRAGLSPALAERLAEALEALCDCRRATAAALDGVTPEGLPRALGGDAGGGWLDAGRFAGVRACVGPLRAAAEALELHLASPEAAAEPPASIDLWPVLRVETGTQDDVYVHDYVLLVDAGGNDIYADNAGSNMLDLKWGPGPPAPNLGPARGCQTALQDFSAGKCFPAAALLLDLAGDDSYGVFEAPDPLVDAKCTADAVVRRSVTIGVGVAGVGILRDVAGNDRYQGKTGAVGAGHIFGVGLLLDGGGNDSYLAVRNSEGFALLGGVGILHDEGGNDAYDFYLPTPLDPSAQNLQPGAGGVIDDIGLCDRIPRFTEGAANLGQGLGALVDDGGDDSYRGSLVATFQASISLAGGVPAGSQGFGANGAFGLFLDAGGTDAYDGVPDRSDGAIVTPGSPSAGTGLFVDR